MPDVQEQKLERLNKLRRLKQLRDMKAGQSGQLPPEESFQSTAFRPPQPARDFPDPGQADINTMSRLNPLQQEYRGEKPDRYPWEAPPQPTSSLAETGKQTLLAAGSGTYQKLANLFKTFSRGADDVSELFGTPRRERGKPYEPKSVVGDYLQGLADYTRPTKEISGFVPKVLSGTALGAYGLAELTAGGPGTVLPMAVGLGAASVDPSDPAGQLASGAESGLLISALKGLAPLSRGARIGTGTSVFGGLSAAEGGDVADVTAQSIIGGGLSAGGKAEGRGFRDIARDVRRTPLTEAPIKPKALKPKPLPSPVESKPVEPVKVITEPKKPPTEPVVKKPVAEKAPPSEEFIGLTKAEITEIRAEKGFTDLSKPEKRSIVERTNKAIERGLDKKEKALETAKIAIDTKQLIGTEEHIGLVLERRRLIKEGDALSESISKFRKEGKTAEADIERARLNILEDNLETLTRGASFGSTEVARAFQARKTRVAEDLASVTTVKNLALEEKGQGKKLSEKENKKFEKFAEENKRLEKELEDLVKADEVKQVERDRLEAENIALREVSKAKITAKTAKVRQTIRTERADIKGQLKELGFRVNDISGITAEGAFLVGKLAKNYIREGANTLADVVQKVRVDVPELSVKDVYKALISTDPKRQRKARNQAQKNVAQLKRQAKLLIDIEKAEQGVFAKPKKAKPQPLEIVRLQKQLRELRKEAFRSTAEGDKLERALQKIDELSDNLVNFKRDIIKKRPIESSELQNAREKLRDIRREMKVEDQLADINQQLESGEFKIPDPKPVRQKPVQLQKKEAELSLKRKETREAIRDMRKGTVRKVVSEVASTLRTAKTIGEASGVLRQGLPLIIAKPGAAPKALTESMKATFSANKAEQIMLGIKEQPQHFIRERSGLELKEIGGRLSKGEELFASKWLEKIPGLGSVVRASERQFVTFLNMMRVTTFDKFLLDNPNATRAELRAWADFVNVASGIGRLNAGTAEVLSTVLFAPRFTASRLQLPFQVFRKQPPRVRKAVAKEMVKTASLGMLALYMADAAGLNVGTNPDDSDFGKIVVGNTRIDIFAGFQQSMRAMARIGIGSATAGKQIVVDRELKQKGFNPIDIAIQFGKYKLSPAITTGAELVRGKDIVGQQTTATETAAKAFLPLFYEDLYEAWKLEGSRGVALTAPLGFFGVGISTFEKGRKKKSKFGKSF